MSEIFKNDGDDLINDIIINEVMEKIECKEIREKVCETSIKKTRVNSVSERERDTKKHPMLSPCSCKKNCLDRVSEDIHKKIYETFWKHKYDKRAYFIHSRTSVLSMKRRKLSKGIRVRNASYRYSFADETGCNQAMCQNFFLKTLGYKSHKLIQTICSKSENGDLPSPVRQGKSVPPNKSEDGKLKDIDAHSMSYDPSISHYRRSHAPNRLYLGSELSISQMYRNYLESGGKGSYDIYRRQVNVKKHRIYEARARGM